MSTKKVLMGILTVIGYILMIAIMLPIAFIQVFSKPSKRKKWWWEKKPSKGVMCG